MNHNILVFNAGSSTLKYKLFDGNLKSVLSGKFEQFGDNKYKLIDNSNNNTNEVTLSWEKLEYDEAINIISQKFTNNNFPKYIGHRVVHGGHHFNKATIIDDYVKSIIQKYSSVAPLHNPFQLKCIESSQNIFQESTNFAVFDTAFHSSMPSTSYTYPIPIQKL